MVQIFISKEKVDQYVYLCQKFGWRLYYKIKDLEYLGRRKGHKSALEYLKKYTNDPHSIIYEKNFQKLFEQHKNKWKEINKKEVKENPIINLVDFVQGRVVFFPGFFEDTQAHFYNLASEKSRKEYEKKRDKIIDEMINDWIEKEGYEKLIDDKKNMPLIKLLRRIKKGQKDREKHVKRVQKTESKK